MIGGTDLVFQFNARGNDPLAIVGAIAQQMWPHCVVDREAGDLNTPHLVEHFIYESTDISQRTEEEGVTDDLDDRLFHLLHKVNNHTFTVVVATDASRPNSKKLVEAMLAHRIVGNVVPTFFLLSKKG